MKSGFDQWALVELMGHQRIAGKVTEAEIGGCSLLRVDVPESNGRQPLTKYLGAASIYAITPVSEETARALAERIAPEPITAWDASRMLENQASREFPAEVDDEGDDEGMPF